MDPRTGHASWDRTRCALTLGSERVTGLLGECTGLAPPELCIDLPKFWFQPAMAIRKEGVGFLLPTAPWQEFPIALVIIIN